MKASVLASIAMALSTAMAAPYPVENARLNQNSGSGIKRQTTSSDPLGLQGLIENGIGGVAPPVQPQADPLAPSGESETGALTSANARRDQNSGSATKRQNPAFAALGTLPGLFPPLGPGADGQAAPAQGPADALGTAGGLTGALVPASGPEAPLSGGETNPVEDPQQLLPETAAQGAAASVDPGVAESPADVQPGDTAAQAASGPAPDLAGNQAEGGSGTAADEGALIG